MSIPAIRLRNFRGFSDVVLHLKPLTVLLGPNSSGKSSFSHPLSALAHCQRVYSGRRDSSLSPENVQKAEEWPIDLGGHADLVTSGCKDKVYIHLLTTEGWVEYGFGLVPTAPDDLWLSYIAYPRDVDVSLSSVIQTPEANKAPLSIETPPLNATLDVERGINKFFGTDEEGRLVLERINEQQWRHQGHDAILGLDGLIPVALQHSGGTEIKFNRKSVSEIKSLLQETIYLRASRKRPSRGYPRFRSEQKSLGYAGERTASVLLNKGQQRGSLIVPPPPVSRVAKGDFEINWQQRETTLEDAVSGWLAHLELAEKLHVAESQRYGSEYIDVRVNLSSGRASRDITEVGFAVSQALPVVVGALLQPEEGLFIVDLPEAHLHPRPQADIADLFCSLAMSGRSALVETHSEMFFQRLRLRAAMDQELMNRIAVYFVDVPSHAAECCAPREVGLDFHQELKWPAGFLQEAIDSEIQIKSIRRSKS